MIALPFRNRNTERSAETASPQSPAQRMLVITNWRDLDHPDAGGAEVVCENLAACYARWGYRVVYLTAAVAGKPHEESRSGFRIVRRGSRYTVYGWALVWLLMRRRKIQAIIDSQNGIPFFTPLAVGRRTPVVLLLHHVHQNQMAAGLPRPLARLGVFLEGPASRMAYGRRAIVAVSPSTRQEIRQALQLTGPITIAPPGLDRAPTTARTRAPHPRIVCVGRLTTHKRTELILEIMPTLRTRFADVELHIVGEGDRRPVLEARAGALGLDGTVAFHGALPAADRDRLLASAWMSINASAAEGWGLSVIEANALGVPVLAIHRPGLRDSVRDGETGWLVDDESHLADGALAALEDLADPARAAEWSARTRAWAGCFSWPEMAERILRTIRAEQARLALDSSERRSANDAVTIIDVPDRVAPEWWSPKLRMTDQVIAHATGRLLVLPGTDTASARLVLVRSGLPEPIAYDDAIVCSVARSADLMVPGGLAGRLDPAREHAPIASAGLD